MNYRFGVLMPQKFVVLVALSLAAGACRSAPPPAAPVPVPQQVGTWQGTGHQTIGFDSQSGRFRIQWETRLEPGAAEGTFRLTVHSGVSGRPLQQVVDHRGAGQGSVNFEDDPRLYQLMVDSTGVQWSVVVDEIVLAPPPRQP
jgi:hypothetical protein